MAWLVVSIQHNRKGRARLQSPSALPARHFAIALEKFPHF
jgi:hypothetical protein